MNRYNGYSCDKLMTAEERKNEFDKENQLKKHIVSCQKGHSKRKSKKHIK